jgi:hypothetical protein
MELQTLVESPKATRTVYPARPNVSFMNQAELMEFLVPGAMAPEGRLRLAKPATQ